MDSMLEWPREVLLNKILCVHCVHVINIQFAIPYYQYIIIYNPKSNRTIDPILIRPADDQQLKRFAAREEEVENIIGQAACRCCFLDVFVFSRSFDPPPKKKQEKKYCTILYSLIVLYCFLFVSSHELNQTHSRDAVFYVWNTLRLCFFMLTAVTVACGKEKLGGLKPLSSPETCQHKVSP